MSPGGLLIVWGANPFFGGDKTTSLLAKEIADLRSGAVKMNSIQRLLAHSNG
jgi:hypothetical protein